MKVSIYEGVKSIRFEERPVPEADPGEIVVKVKYCGICGTDVGGYWNEIRGTPGNVWGHETVGIISQVGAGIDDWKVGDRVVVSTPLSPGFAEYTKVQNPQELLRIPDEVSFEDAVLWDPMSVALKAVRKSRLKIGDNVLVAGAGAIGLATVQWLKLGGAGHITVLEPAEKKWELALKSGADICLNPVTEGANIGEKIKALYEGTGPEIAFECSGAPQSFADIIWLVKPGGQLIVVGVTRRESPITEQMIVRQEIEIKGSRIFSPQDIRLCLQFLAKRRFNTEGMVSEIISLDDIEKGLERLGSPEDNGLIKVVVAP